MKIVVIGGTGLIGSKVVEKLKQHGHEAVAAAPNTGVDTITGKGLAESLAGARVVVDVSNSPSLEDHAAMDFFETSSRNIIAAEFGAGVRHHIVLSVVGTARLQESGYFRAKLAQEQLIGSSPVPYTLVHATQFFEFMRSIARPRPSATPCVCRRSNSSRWRPRTSRARSRTSRSASPANGMIEIAGPETYTLDETVRKVLEFDRDPRRVIADTTAPYYGVQVTATMLMPGPDARIGSTSFDWWLTHVPAPPKVAVQAPVAEPTH